MLAAAAKDSFKELKDHAHRAKAAADPDPAGTQRRIHDSRRLVEFIDAEGAWNLHARGTVADGAKIHAALAPIIEERFRANRAAGRRDAGEANAFDALVEAATRTGIGGSDKPGRYLGLIRTTLSRKATAAMIAAFAWRSPTCTVEGCGRTILQIDHAFPGRRHATPPCVSWTRSARITTTARPTMDGS